jgi:hypothetical protein
VSKPANTRPSNKSNNNNNKFPLLRNKDPTEDRGLVVDAPVSYAGVPRFKSRPGDRLS